MKTHIKKALSLIMTVLMLVTMFPLSVFAEDDILSYLSYEIFDGEVTITDCDESISGDFVIPDTIEGYPVTSIGVYAFQYCSSLESVTIPDSVTSIGLGAFFDCTSLESITIPDSVTSIGESAFAYCKSLKSVTIGNSITSIGGGAFHCCYSLESITIPDSVTSIGYGAFYLCNSLKSITIPDNVTSICERAFDHCTSLESITIPGSVTSIGDDAFRNCTSLESITASEDNKYYSSDEYGVLFNKDKTTLIQYPIGNSRTEYTIPDSVTSIGDGAFSYCRSLENVTIHNGVTSIGLCAFYSCSNLTSIDIPNSVKSIGENAFTFCTSLANITIFNPACEIYYSSIPSTAIIFGYAGSTAEEFAEKYSLTFVEYAHRYNAVVTAPTCTEQGYTTYTCACGYSYVADYVDANGHKDSDNDAICDSCDFVFETNEDDESGKDNQTGNNNGASNNNQSGNNTTGEYNGPDCFCACHSNNSFISFFYKILRFIRTLLGLNYCRYCDCPYV